MDAHSSQNGVPYVIVEFSFGELLCSDYPELIQSLPERLKACSEYCQGDNAKDPYAEKYEYLVDHINGSIGYYHMQRKVMFLSSLLMRGNCMSGMSRR